MKLIMLDAAGFVIQVAEIRQMLKKIDILGEQLNELELEAGNLESKRDHILNKESLSYSPQIGQ